MLLHTGSGRDGKREGERRMSECWWYNIKTTELGTVEHLFILVENTEGEKNGQSILSDQLSCFSVSRGWPANPLLLIGQNIWEKLWEIRIMSHEHLHMLEGVNSPDCFLSLSPLLRILVLFRQEVGSPNGLDGNSHNSSCYPGTIAVHQVVYSWVMRLWTRLCHLSFSLLVFR